MSYPDSIETTGDLHELVIDDPDRAARMLWDMSAEIAELRELGDAMAGSAEAWRAARASFA